MLVQLLAFVATLFFVWLVLSAIRAGSPVTYLKFLTKVGLNPVTVVTPPPVVKP